MKNCNTVEDVTFSFTSHILLEMARADSSYIATSLYAVAAEKSDVMPFVITEDEMPFVLACLRNAYNELLTRLMAYVGEGSRCNDECFEIVLKLPVARRSEIDNLIAHELQRAYVTYLLSRWYENKLPDIAMRQLQLYEAAVAMARHDIFVAYGGMKRKPHYI